MSLIEDLKQGYTPGAFNNAPFIPSAIWYQRVPLNTASITGLTLFGYVQLSETSKERLFDLDITTEVDSGKVFACLSASTVNTADLVNAASCFVTFGFVEDATNETHVLYRGTRPVDSEVL